MAGEDVSERLAPRPFQISQSGYRLSGADTEGHRPHQWARNLLVSPAGLAPILQPHSLPSSEPPSDAGVTSYLLVCIETDGPLASHQDQMTPMAPLSPSQQDRTFAVLTPIEPRHHLVLEGQSGAVLPAWGAAPHAPAVTAPLGTAPPLAHLSMLSVRLCSAPLSVSPFCPVVKGFQ